MPLLSRKPRPITIHDVALRAGVSIATVSNVLKGRMSEVSPATAERVQRVVEKMGYVKNLTAAALSSQRSGLVGAIIIGVFDPHSTEREQEVNPFYGEFLFRLERELQSSGSTLCVYAGREEAYVNFLLERNLDGAILLGVIGKDMPTVLERRDARLVLFDSFVHHRTHMRVQTDELKGGGMSADFLITRGRKHLAFVGGAVRDFPSNIPAVRFEGATRVCDQSGIRLLLVEEWTSFEGGRRAARRVLELKPDGVIVAADIMAAGLVRGLQEAGAKVPDDIAVVGYDDLPFARMVSPPLTTVRQGLQEKIEAAVDLLKNGEKGEVRVIKPHLVVRESA
ncbi:MAG: LacI family DNA-binding transcriptional regulator [Kiritimatiellae bacterium]|nr:LacI family DNA-binding transcriptional regulator [Kiritimatiellia bacterium]